MKRDFMMGLGAVMALAGLIGCQGINQGLNTTLSAVNQTVATANGALHTVAQAQPAGQPAASAQPAAQTATSAKPAAPQASAPARTGSKKEVYEISRRDALQAECRGKVYKMTSAGELTSEDYKELSKWISYSIVSVDSVDSENAWKQSFEKELAPRVSAAKAEAAKKAAEAEAAKKAAEAEAEAAKKAAEAKAGIRRRIGELNKECHAKVSALELTYEEKRGLERWIDASLRSVNSLESANAFKQSFEKRLAPIEKRLAEKVAARKAEEAKEIAEAMAKRKELLAKIDADVAIYTNKIAALSNSCQECFAKCAKILGVSVKDPPFDTLRKELTTESRLANSVAEFLAARSRYDKDVAERNALIGQLNEIRSFQSSCSEIVSEKDGWRGNGQFRSIEDVKGERIRHEMGVLLIQESGAAREAREISNGYYRLLHKFLDGASSRTSPEEYAGALRKLRDEIVRGRAWKVLAQKLASARIATWTPGLAKIPRGMARDDAFIQLLDEKFNIAGKRMEGACVEGFIKGLTTDENLKDMRTLVASLYPPDLQVAMIDEAKEIRTEDRMPLKIVLAFVCSVNDAALRKTLLIDKTEWVRHCRPDAIDGECAWQCLVAQEKNLDILMAAYEKERYRSKREWMLANCGTEFLKRVVQQIEARRQAAKGETFLMKDFYLGMPGRDFDFILKGWNKKQGSVSVDSWYGWSEGKLVILDFNAKARYAYLGVEKDGMSGLGEFVRKYIPGGMKSVGEIKWGANSNNSWFYVDCPKYDCRILLYKDGDLRVKSTAD